MTTTQQWKRVLQEYCVTTTTTSIVEQQRSTTRIALLDDDDDSIMKRKKQAIHSQLSVHKNGDDPPVVRIDSTTSDTESRHGNDASRTSSSSTSNDEGHSDNDEDTTIIITSSLIPTHPSTSTIDKVMESLHYLQGLNLTRTPIIITIDGLTLQDRLQSPEKVQRLYQYANKLRTKYVTNPHHNSYNNVQIVFQLDRKYLVGNIQHVMRNHVNTTFVYILQHDIQFIQPINHKAIVRTLQESRYYHYNKNDNDNNNHNKSYSSPSNTTTTDSTYENDVRLVRFPGTSTLIREGIDDIGICGSSSNEKDGPNHHHHNNNTTNNINITDTTLVSTAATTTTATVQSIRLNGIELTKTHVWSDRNHITTKSYYMEMFSTIKGFQTTTGGGGATPDVDDGNDRLHSSTTTTTTKRRRRRGRNNPPPPRYMERVMQPIAMKNCSYWGTYLYGSVHNYTKMTIHLHGRTSTLQ